MCRGLFSAIQFLTILPLGSPHRFQANKAMPFFPIVGLVIGGLLALVDYVAAMIWPQQAVAVLDVVFLAVITGALHIDGLADASDGLYGRRTTERALEIMKDSRIGAIGMVAVVCCLAIKWAGLSSALPEIQTFRPFWLCVVPAISRSTVMIAVRLLPYGRPDGGTGRPFFQHPLGAKDYWPFTVLAVIMLMMDAWGALWMSIGAILLTAAILLYYRIKINCITGDMLGAMIEVTESGLFLLMAAYGRFL